MYVSGLSDAFFPTGYEISEKNAVCLYCQTALPSSLIDQAIRVLPFFPTTENTLPKPKQKAPETTSIFPSVGVGGEIRLGWRDHAPNPMWSVALSHRCVGPSHSN
jgi:hypothetical protein